MASWHEIADEIRKEHSNYEGVRQRYLNKFREHRNGRDFIAYYSKLSRYDGLLNAHFLGLVGFVD